MTTMKWNISRIFWDEKKTRIFFRYYISERKKKKKNWQAIVLCYQCSLWNKQNIPSIRLNIIKSKSLYCVILTFNDINYLDPSHQVKIRTHTHNCYINLVRIRYWRILKKNYCQNMYQSNGAINFIHSYSNTQAFIIWMILESSQTKQKY